MAAALLAVSFGAKAAVTYTITSYPAGLKRAKVDVQNATASEALAQRKLADAEAKRPYIWAQGATEPPGSLCL
jgi:P pilus assembly chaperone PapD